LFPNTLSLCSSLKNRNQVSHPYKTTSKTIVLHILIFTFVKSTRGGEEEEKRREEKTKRKTVAKETGIKEKVDKKSLFCIL
jgi:hypothetical protein